MPSRKTTPVAQLPLAGFDQPATAPASHRLFLGIFPDRLAYPAIASAVAKLVHDCQPSEKLHQPDRHHITVHHLGDYAELPADRVQAALAAIARIGTTAFELTLDHATSFDNRHRFPWVLGCPPMQEGLHALWRESSAYLAAAGFKPWLHSNFTPHLTLLYGSRPMPAPIPKAIEPIRWRVGEVVLVHSLLGKTQYLFAGRKVLADLP